MSQLSTHAAPFGRVLTAMVTPFDADGEVDLGAASQLASDLVDLGCDGLVVNGTTGESPTTSDQEKADLLRAVIDAVGERAQVVAGVGTNDTRHTLHLAAAAVKAGAHGLLLVTPYYNKPSQEGLVAHFTAVADSSDLPVMVYDIPSRSGVPIASETLVQLAEHPRIVANKDAKGDLFAAQQVMHRSDLVYYSGDDALNLPLLAVGAVGVVSVTGHIVADRLSAMVTAYSAGDVATATAINNQLVPVTEGIMTRAQGAVMVKAALELLGRTGGGALRLPLVAATENQREVLRDDLRAGGFDL
jgi:4-hydroxy-tetrahydrodipicolinate synthase